VDSPIVTHPAVPGPESSGEPSTTRLSPAKKPRRRRVLKEPHIVKHRTVFTVLVGALRQYRYLGQVDSRAPRGTPDEIAKWHSAVERTEQAGKKLRAACRAVIRAMSEGA
jgi:hypothetical protein